MAVLGWHTNLTWRQFRRVNTPLGTTEEAQTEASIEPPERVAVAKDGAKFKLTNFDVRVRLVPSGTWIVNGKATDALLAHEQGHWDIAGLTAYEYFRELTGLRADDTDTLQSQASAALERIQTKVDALQEQYDRQTDHSRQASEQARWQRLIATAIRSGNAALPNP
jgi:hypothetical protein